MFSFVLNADESLNDSKDVSEKATEDVVEEKEGVEGKEDEEKEKAKAITNNNLFVGSTTDLQRMLLDHDKKIIDAED